MLKIKKNKFGVLSDGSKVHLFTVSNGNMAFSCTDFGCTLTSIVLNNKDGSKTDVLLGFPTVEGYLRIRFCFGAILGRFGNRISKGSFTLNGKKYELQKNDGPNTLHSGFSGFDTIIWDYKLIENKNTCGVEFLHFSKDGEQGFPGNLKIKVTYLLDESNNLSCTYTAETDQSTPVNISNHAYFNLAGFGTAKNHIIRLNCPQYLEINSKKIPTGKFIDVEGTPFDFREEKPIGQDIDKVGDGYDHCFVTEAYNPENPQCGVPLDDKDLVELAFVKEPESGRCMQVFTNMEGVQFYTANYINGIPGKHYYKAHDGFCLETQCFPDSPNKTEFPTCILEPGQKMKAKTVFSFIF